MTAELRTSQFRPFLGLAGVAVILSATLLVMDLLYRWDASSGFPVWGVALPPLGVASAVALAVWSTFAFGRSGLSARFWIAVWAVAGLAGVVAGYAYADGNLGQYQGALHLQGPSALLVLAVLAAAAWRESRLAATRSLEQPGRRSFVVLALAMLVIAGMELRLWVLMAPARTYYSYRGAARGEVSRYIQPRRLNHQSGTSALSTISARANG